LPDPLYCPNKCGRCYKGLQRKGNLNRHINNECGVPRKFKCFYCGKRFTQKYHLKQHYGVIHKVIANDSLFDDDNVQYTI